MMEGVNSALRTASVPAELIGHPSSPYLQVGAEAEPHFADRLAERCALHGVAIHPAHQWFISAAHTEADIDRLLEAVSTSVRVGTR